MTTAAYQAQWVRDHPEQAYRNQMKSMLKTRYGFTMEGYEALLQGQGGVCAICKRFPPGRGRNGRRLSVDHDHRTGKIRGLLCARCNGGMGSLDDDPERLRAAADYLERFQ